MANANARALRKRMTPQEVKLWLYLRGLRRSGHHFRRQAPIDGYIVDFLCFSARLVIELDGSHHNEPEHRVKDAERDAHLQRCGFVVLRVWNTEIDRNMDGVCQVILEALPRGGKV